MITTSGSDNSSGEPTVVMPKVPATTDTQGGLRVNARRFGMRRHSEAVTVLLEGLVAIVAKAVSPLRFATAVQNRQSWRHAG